MNRIFSIVWNQVVQAWVVASEYARRGKGRSTRRRIVLRRPGSRCGFMVGCLALVTLTPGQASADLPSGGQIVHGEGRIGAPAAGQLIIDQSSHRLAIDWQRFSIGADNTVRFQQPGSDAIALNRVLGADGSSIMGRLQANGRVFLVNPNGILFGQGAQVDVGGLVASTLAISNEDFAAGRYRFEGDGDPAAIINRGRITAADGGAVALLGGQVSNHGIVQARLGSVALAAGQRITLDFAGDGLLNVQIDEATRDALVENHQLIQADGGQVLMTAHASDALLQTVVNNTGVIEARTLENREGRIVLLGGFEGGTVEVAGRLDASAPESGNGGFVDSSGAWVDIHDGAQITTLAVDGKTGTWLIDPTDFTVRAGNAGKTGSGIGAETLSANLENTSVELATVDTGAGAGDIHVNAAVSWDAATTLTLTAHNDIHINADISATSGRLALQYGQAGIAAGNTADYYVNARVNLSAGQNFSTRLGSDGPVRDYTVITSLGTEGDGSGASLQGMNGNLGGYYALGGNINASATGDWNGGAGFDPIGDGANRFTGVFDGLGHAVSGLSIQRESENHVGLFGYVEGGTLRNIGLEGGSVAGNGNVGALAGRLEQGSIQRAYATGSVSGLGNGVGGLVGWNYNASIHASYATGAVAGADHVGGLAGVNQQYARITDSYASGAVSGASRVGGLVGTNTNNGMLSHVYATGAVHGNGYGEGGAGGLAGASTAWATIDHAYATGPVAGSLYVGGLVGDGQGSGTVSNSYWDTDSTGRSSAFGRSGSSNNIGAVVSGSGSAYAQASYAYFDFGNDWVMIEGSTRPFLRSEYNTTIRNAHQLQLMAMDLEADYTLAADIDASATAGGGGRMWLATGFDPIGKDGLGASFTGTLDGLGHVISGLTIDRPDESAVGLFGFIEHGMARNIGLEGGSIKGEMSEGNAGGLAGMAHNTSITQVYTTGSVSGASAGGLVGYIQGGGINQAYATGEISGGIIGGLAGHNVGSSISQAYFAGGVSGMFAGGLVGYSIGGSINQTYATGSVFGDLIAGGLVGENEGAAITDSYWDITGTGMSSSAGGGIGKTSAEMKQLATFDGWDIDDEGGSGAVWRIYEGHTAPLLRAFLTELALSVGGSVTYNGEEQTGGYAVEGAYDPSLLLGSGTVHGSGRNVGSYALNVEGLYSGQRGYDLLTEGMLTITQADIVISTEDVTKTYDGTTDAAGAVVIVGGELFDTDSLSGGSFAFTDQNADTGKTVTVDGVTVSDGNGGGNYRISYVSNTTSTIEARALDVALADQAKVYDGGTHAALTSADYLLSGFVDGEYATVTQTSGAYNSKNVSGAHTVTVTLGDDDFTAGTGTLLSNYILPITASGAGAISAAVLTADGGAVENSRVYDGSAAAAVINNGTLGGTVFNADDVSLALIDTEYVNGNAGTGKSVTGQYVILGDDAANYRLADADFNSTADIAQATLTAGGGAVEDSREYNGGVAAAVIDHGALGGTVFGVDDVSLALIDTEYTDKNAGTGKVVSGQYVILGADAANYRLADADFQAAADITQATLVASGGAVEDSRVYDGGVAAAVINNGTLGGTVFSADDVRLLLVDTVYGDKNAGAGKTVTGQYVIAGEDAANYRLADADFQTTADITARLLAVTADDLSKISGQFDPALTWRFAGPGLAGGDRIDEVFSGGLKRASGEEPGVYAIGQGTLDTNANYQLSFTAGELRIEPSWRYLAAVASAPDMGRSPTTGLPWYIAEVDEAVFDTSSGSDPSSPSLGRDPSRSSGFAQGLYTIVNGGLRLPEGL